MSRRNLMVGLIGLLLALPVAPAFSSDLCPSFLKRLSFRADPRLVPDRSGGLKLSMLPPGSKDTTVLEAIPALYSNLLGVKALSDAYRAVQADPRDVPFFTKWADGFGVTVSPNPEAGARIPEKGGLLVVANHPLFGVDGAAIAKVLETVRTDVKVIMTESFEHIPEMKDHAIFVSIQSDSKARARNIRVLRDSIQWLKDGHAVVIFPSGSPSRIVKEDVPIPLDSAWSPSIERMLLKSGASALPVYVEGSASPLYLKLFNRKATRGSADLRLMNEISRIRGQDIPLTFGEPVSDFGFLRTGENPVEPGAISQFLRDRTYELGNIPPDRSGVPEPLPE